MISAYGELHNTESAALEAMRAPRCNTGRNGRYHTKNYERPDPAVAHDDVRAQITKETFDGNYGRNMKIGHVIIHRLKIVH